MTWLTNSTTNVPQYGGTIWYVDSSIATSGAGTDGALHHHCDWEPLSDNGFVEVV